MVLASSAMEQISLSIYVHEGNLNGTMLTGAQVSGQDADGSSMTATTDSNGVAVLNGVPGTWQLAIEKDNYQPIESTTMPQRPKKWPLILRRQHQPIQFLSRFMSLRET